MGKPYNARRRNLCLIAYKLRQEGKTNKEIASQLLVDVKKIPGMVLTGSRIKDGLQLERNE